MNVLRVTASMDPAMGGPPQGIRNSIAELERLGIRNEAVCCDAPDAAWLGTDAFPVHALGPGKYGFAYTPKLGPWLEENLPRFDAVIVHGLWLWTSTCAVRAVARERKRRRTKQIFSHGLGKINADGSERLAADRTGGHADCRMTSTAGGLSSEKSDIPESLNAQPSTFNSKQLRCFVMPHGMLDPWFQRDKSRRVKAVRNWFYWWLVERGVVNSADALLFTCQQELELARTTFGDYRPKREVNVGYGIAEPPAFEPEMEEAFSARCPDLNGRPYLLFMSRIHPKKNVAALVRAYARVRSKVTSDEWRVTSGQSPEIGGQKSDGIGIPDLVIAGPGWESRYGTRIKELIREQGDWPDEVAAPSQAKRSETADGEDAAATKSRHSARIHAVDMLQGDAKWGALYGCEAFVLPSHQENFGIAVVEALACGKPVLISDQVNIWREIAEDGAGLVEGDTEEGVEKLLRQFLCGMRHEADDGVSHGLGKMDEDASERFAADRTGGHADCRMTSTAGGLPPETADGGPRACYLKRFAIGPAAASLARALQEE